jgi:hypothetical protein
MQRFFLSPLVLVALLPLSYPQSPRPISAPDDIVLRLETVGASRELRLGELIPIKYSYSAKTPGRYLWVSQSAKLEGGRALEISCSSSEEGGSNNLGSADRVSFDQLLVASCGGSGGSAGASCFDCGAEQPLTESALNIGPEPLNKYVRFRTAGTYTCEASAADVTTTAARDDKNQPALLVTSNPIVLTIVNDPVWARSAASAYGDAYGKLCRGEHYSVQCPDIAERLTYLDTVNSLAEEVKWFDGRNQGWNNVFWAAIQHSSQPQDALRLMTSRIQEPDFQASNEIIEWLASAELRIEVPDAFRGDALATYHDEAVELLRKYVRLLGSSLSKKDPLVLGEAVKTYRNVAGRRYCDEALIPSDEQNSVLMDLH